MASGDAFNDSSRAFLDWFRALPGATFSNAITIQDLRHRGAGRGIVATRDILPGTSLFKIPRASILSTAVSPIAQLFPSLHAEETVGEDGEDGEDEVEDWEASTQQPDPWTSLILVLLHEHFRGSASPWAPYLAVLPTSFDTPMFWSASELEELQGSALVRKIGKEEAEAKFRREVVPIIRKNGGGGAGSVGPNESVTFFEGSQNLGDDELVELCHRMGSTIMAYAFDLEGDDEEDQDDEDEDGWVEDRDGKLLMGMVPMADMMNADAEFNAHVNHGDDCLEVTALRLIKAGEEVLNYYGPHPNSELLRRYGYTTPKHARHDVVEVPWNLLEEAIARELGLSKHQRKQARDRVEDETGLEDVVILERDTPDPNADGTLPDAEPLKSLPESMTEPLKSYLKALRKIQPDGSAAAAIADNKRKRDELMTHAVVQALQVVLNSYGSSAEEDEEILKQNEAESVQPRKYMAVQVRLGEKKLIQETLAALKQEDGDEDMNRNESSKRARTTL